MWWPIKERPHLTWNWSFSLLFKLSGAYLNQQPHTERNISSLIQVIVEVIPTHSSNFYKQSSPPTKNRTKQIISCHLSGWTWLLTQLDWGRWGVSRGHSWAFESLGHWNAVVAFIWKPVWHVGDGEGYGQEASVWEFKKGPKLDQKYGQCPKVFLLPKAARQGSFYFLCASCALSSVIR